jgi:hypothetical protein
MSDYLRQYTWDKLVETQVKSLGMIAGKGSPTVIPPDSYKERFRWAMNSYFGVSLDRFVQEVPKGLLGAPPVHWPPPSELSSRRKPPLP